MTAAPLLAPYDGEVVPLVQVPDPVLSAGLLGASVALDPKRRAGQALAPIGGTVQTLHAHAFIVAPGDDSPPVLVHLGVDTVGLDGRGFTARVGVGDVVGAGAPVIDWDPAFVVTQGLSPMVVVAALGTEPGALRVALGPCTAGAPLRAARDRP